MIINDKVYGKTTITEPVLLELLKSSALLRLKKISQYGIPDKYYHLKNFSRYEHSVGVMILLKKLGAPVEEQIAGLLHDVSHQAFSHVADWLFGAGRQGVEDYHDLNSERFMRKTAIPDILKKHGFEFDRIMNDNNFPLLEKKLPMLCADRVDYALREFEAWLDSSIVNRCVNAIASHNNEIVFSDLKATRIFALNFLKLQTEHWGGYEAMMRYHLFSSALRIAIDSHVLNEDDFFQDEKFVMDKLENIQDERIQKTLETLRSKKLKKQKNPGGEKVIKKFRYVDPKILINDKLVCLSEIDDSFLSVVAEHRANNEKGLLV